MRLRSVTPAVRRFASLTVLVAALAVTPAAQAGPLTKVLTAVYPVGGLVPPRLPPLCPTDVVGGNPACALPPVAGLTIECGTATGGYGGPGQVDNSCRAGAGTLRLRCGQSYTDPPLTASYPLLVWTGCDGQVASILLAAGCQRTTYGSSRGFGDEIACAAWPVEYVDGVYGTPPDYASHDYVRLRIGGLRFECFDGVCHPTS
jgi:hypothetical protein